jgi:hypothetical protein
MTVTRIQYHPETGLAVFEGREGLPAGVVPRQMTSSGVTRPRLRGNLTGGTLSYTSSGEKTTFPVAIPRSCEFNTAGVGNL